MKKQSWFYIVNLITIQNPSYNSSCVIWQSAVITCISCFKQLFDISLRAGSHFRCYNRCGTRGESHELRGCPPPTRNSRLRCSCHIDYNKENESLLAGYFDVNYMYLDVHNKAVPACTCKLALRNKDYT